MSVARYFVLWTFVASVAILGCTKPAEKQQAAVPGEDLEVAQAMAELDLADRALARAQRVCVVSDKSMLGSMGKPYKLMVEGQPVFLCCEACKDEALKDPKATLARVEQLKKTTAESTK